MTQQPTPQPRPMMSLPDAIKTCLRKYADFSGRAARPEYWWWVLAVALIALVAGLLISLAVTLRVLIWSIIWLVRQGPNHAPTATAPTRGRWKTRLSDTTTAPGQFAGQPWEPYPTP